MDAENMSVDELLELARQKQGEAETPRETVEVNGFKFHVNAARLGGWRAFKLVSALDDPQLSEFGKVQAAIDLMEYLTDLKADDIVDALGGDLASPMEVLDTVTKVIAAVYPKN